MRLSRIAVVVASVASVVGLVVEPTARPAEAEENCEIGDGGVIDCWVIIDLVPDKIVRVGPAPDDESAGWVSPLVWRRTFVGNFDENGYLAACGPRPPDVAPGTLAALYLIELVNTVTGEVVELDSVCVWRQEDPPPEPPPGVLQPPTVGEFVEAHRQVLTVETQISPDPSRSAGLTGLDTWLWCDDPGALSLGVSLRGWTAEATVTPTEYSWAITGATTAAFTSPACGSEPQPAATWMPETKGTRTVDFATTWEGVWTLSWNGIPVGTFPLGPVTVDAEPLSYPVLEYYGVLEGDR